jgi:hypothetical protein
MIGERPRRDVGIVGTRPVRYGEGVSRRPARVLLLLAGLSAGCSIFHIGPPSGAVDLNRADASAIAALPGLTTDDGRRIVANRPYASKEDLLRRHVLGESEYARIADRVYVGAPGMPDYLRSVPPQPEGP